MACHIWQGIWETLYVYTKPFMKNLSSGDKLADMLSTKGGLWWWHWPRHALWRAVRRGRLRQMWRPILPPGCPPEGKGGPPARRGGREDLCRKGPGGRVGVERGELGLRRRGEGGEDGSVGIRQGVTGKEQVKKFCPVTSQFVNYNPPQLEKSIF